MILFTHSCRAVIFRQVPAQSTANIECNISVSVECVQEWADGHLERCKKIVVIRNWKCFAGRTESTLFINSHVVDVVPHDGTFILFLSDWRPFGNTIYFITYYCRCSAASTHFCFSVRRSEQKHITLLFILLSYCFCWLRVKIDANFDDNKKWKKTEKQKFCNDSINYIRHDIYTLYCNSLACTKRCTSVDRWNVMFDDYNLIWLAI